MTNPVKFFPMILAQFGRQKLERIPEEESKITDKPDDVVQYNQVMDTALAVLYAVGLTVIHRARPDTAGRATRALDLASGPGHYTLCLQTHLKYTSITGIDWSDFMVETARKNALEKQLGGQASFEKGDITDLTNMKDDSFDLCSCTDAAHHLDDEQVVAKMLTEMDRVTRPDGLVMLMDLARLRTRKLTEKYVQTLGADYKEKGLPDFYDQFHDSMFAAFTWSEMQSAIPTHSRRVWCQLVSKRLPTLQVILGLPVGRERAFVRKGYPWAAEDCPVPEQYRRDWFFARATLFSSPVKYFPAARKAA